MKKEEQIMAGLWNLFNKKIWLDEYKMKDRLKGFTPSEIHCIEYIGEHGDSNVTKLADSFYMTRSAISKLAKKLMEKDLIESYQKSDNKKEIYFKLTSHGTQIYTIHKKLHMEFQDRDQFIFDGLTKEQLDGILLFAQKYNTHLDAEMQKLGLNMKSESFDTF